MTGTLDIPVHQGAGLVVPLQWGNGTSAEDIEEFDLTGALIELKLNGNTYLMDKLEIRLTAAQTEQIYEPVDYTLVVTLPGAEPTHVLEGKLLPAHMKEYNNYYGNYDYGSH